MDDLERMGPLGKVEYLFSVCERHQRDYCPICFFDFRDMNESALQQAANEELLLCRAEGCLEKAVKSCSSCMNVKYCGQTCGKRDWKARHKEECTRAKGSQKGIKPARSPTLRINMACGIMDDTFVDIFPVNTKLIMYSRNPNNPAPLRGKVVGFSKGRGAYANPEVKYNPRIHAGLTDDDMCTYIQSSTRMEM